MIIKCKMCGGDMELSADQRTGVCEYCGSTMTLPKVDDDQRAAAFNRGNHFRRIGEFDKALSVYEGIVREDEKDAEAHWCCALCRFGIEYVKDPTSGEYLPTCHRASFDSFLEDVDYKAALEHADVVARRQYEKDAAVIAQVQRGILSISQKEKPFDVFLCYKESDASGNRTVDSTLAQDIYYQLTEQGRRVFFARITLEDKAGQEYEPYIFAALHSARVMIVVGTKPEYLNAVWVKNEWSRYLTLMKHDRKRLLIPCYRDMDPYDLPEQLSVLQSYDMGKIGFIQDLIRGVAKVLDADKKPEEKVIERVVEHGGAAPGIESLMKRVYLFMEDGDFTSAEEYVNRVLDIDPEYAPAYAARTCIALQFRRESQLGEATFLFESNPDWRKALRFARDEQKSVYEGYMQKTTERVNRQIRDYTYDCAMEIAVNPSASGKIEEELEKYRISCRKTEPGQRARGGRRENWQANETAFRRAVKEHEPGSVTEAAYQRAAELLERLKEDREAAECAKQCRRLSEQARQKKIYTETDENCQAAKERRNAAKLLEAAERFHSILEYKDAQDREKQCRKQAEEIQGEEYAKAAEAMKSAGTESGKWKEVCWLLNSANLDGYQDVEQLRGQAKEQFRNTNEAEERILKQKREAERKKKKKQDSICVAMAALLIASLLMYANVISPMMQYKKAESLLAAEKYDEAAEVFAALEDYKDAPERVLETQYARAESLLAAEKYDEAAEVFAGLGDYKDADTVIYTNKELRDRYFAVGNEVTYGHYEQDGDTADGMEEIEWIVLARDGETALLISKYGLDVKAYHNTYEDITWQNCSLRQWLNGDFIQTAFKEEEEQRIKVTGIDNSQLQGKYRNTNGGSNTEDQVFLLSYKEAFEDYFTDDTSRICKATAYAESHFAWSNSDGDCSWWLRSSGVMPEGVYQDGSSAEYLFSVNDDYVCVRPALWINLDSDIF